MLLSTWLYSDRLLEGWFPNTVWVLSTLSLGFLLLRRQRRWWIFAGITVGVIMGSLLRTCMAARPRVLCLGQEDLPLEVVGWTALGVFAAAAAVGNMVRGRLLRTRLHRLPPSWF